MKQKRPLTKEEYAALHTEMICHYDIATVPLLSRKDVAVSYWERYQEPSNFAEAVEEINANMDFKRVLFDLTEASMAIAVRIAEAKAWWTIYDAGRREFFAAIAPGVEAEDYDRFNGSDHFDGVAFSQFVGRLEDAISRLYAYREKVLVCARTALELRGDRQGAKDLKGPSFDSVINTNRQDASDIKKRLKAAFCSPDAETLITKFRHQFTHGVTPSIDFPSRPVASVLPDGTPWFGLENPEYKSDQLLDLITKVWASYIDGTNELLDRDLQVHCQPT